MSDVDDDYNGHAPVNPRLVYEDGFELPLKLEMLYYGPDQATWKCLTVIDVQGRGWPVFRTDEPKVRGLAVLISSSQHTWVVREEWEAPWL